MANVTLDEEIETILREAGTAWERRSMRSPEKIDPIHVVDTHALLWHLTNERMLSERVRAIFAAAERGGTRRYQRCTTASSPVLRAG